MSVFVSNAECRFPPIQTDYERQIASYMINQICAELSAQVSIREVDPIDELNSAWFCFELAQLAGALGINLPRS